MLPLTLAFNIVLASSRAFWPLVIAGNLPVALAWAALR
jgi:hypothetical protein